MKCKVDLYEPPAGQSDAPWLPQSTRSAESTGCMLLWAYVVDQAAKDLRDDRELVRREARQWIVDAQEVRVGGFAWVCHIFGVDVDRARTALMRLANSIEARRAAKPAARGS